jgi:hypothetical protein
LRFLFFLKRWSRKLSGLKIIFLLGWLCKLYKKTLVVRLLVRFLIVLAKCVGYLTFSFINSVKVTAKGISAAAK